MLFSIYVYGRGTLDALCMFFIVLAMYSICIFSHFIY